MEKISLIHKKLTDEECYQNVKEMYKKYPDIIMKPSKWKKLRLKHLKKEGK